MGTPTCVHRLKAYFIGTLRPIKVGLVLRLGSMYASGCVDALDEKEEMSCEFLFPFPIFFFFLISTYSNALK